ncbi:MAG: hypothetical protein Q8R00_03040 [Candidatus Nanoarchaeia archaeon]|nr:hypothetical protein [Candidatus Nanoarchaeia archaeon]
MFNEYKENMIYFEFRFGRAIIPTKILNSKEVDFLRKKDIKKNDKLDRYYGDVYDLPTIFYNSTATNFFDIKVPRYVQALSSEPFSSVFEHYNKDYNKEVLKSEIKLFQQDLEELDINPFYNHLFNLSNINISFDKESNVGSHFDFNSRSIIYGEAFKKNLSDLDWFTISFMHELYHLIEVELENKVKESFDNGRWKLRSLGVKDTKNKINNLSWAYNQNNYGSLHLAELLAALTFIRKPEVKEKILPYHHSLCERLDSNYMPLFPSEGLNVWGKP